MPHCLILIVLVSLFFVSPVAAEQKKYEPTSNYKQSDEYLPGEEVVTPAGQKMKVWSTKGEVKVHDLNPQPPGAYPRADVDLVIDARKRKHKIDRENKATNQDTFDRR